ncbi:hypothetical protein [Streptomyces sp. NPDC050988]|uniref:hypothetical protein n=1 Tax=Streptomyces sp. NPDC050988 TaxID=3365637 RepID=UPI0037AD9C64
MDTSTGLLPDGLDQRLADTVRAGALMSVTGPDAAVAETAVNGVLDAGLPVVRIRLDSAGASVAQPEFARLLAAELGLGRHGAAPWPVADVEERIEDELARRGVVLVVHGSERMLTEALYWLYRVWSRTAPGRRLTVVFTGSQGFDRVLARPALADLKSCIFIHHRLAA